MLAKGLSHSISNIAKLAQNKWPSFNSFQHIIDQLKGFLSKIENIKNNPNQQILGLDIQQDSIKLLKLSNLGSGKYKVDWFRQQDLPQGAIVKHEIQQSQTVAQAIKTALQEYGGKDHQVALAIPRSLAIIKNINFSMHLSSDEVESRVWIEAQRHFPELINDIYLDFAIVGPSKDDESQLDCLLVASRKNHVQPYLSIAKECNIDLKVVDVDCFALERAMSLLQINPQEVVALINLNNDLSTIIVMHNNRLIYSHDQAFHGAQLNKQAHEFLKSSGMIVDIEELLNNPKYSNILKTNLLSHLQHCIHFFYTSCPNITIDNLWVSGSCARVKGIAEFIEKEINIKTGIVNLGNKLELAESTDVELFQQSAPGLMLCCGLAMSKVEV